MIFSDLTTAVKAVVFPIGEPENLVAIHNTYIADALNNIQEFVRCYRDQNVNVVAFSDTVYNCGLTVTDTPDGFIKRVYSLSSDNCCRVNYVKSNLPTLRFKEQQHEIDFEETKRPTQPTTKAPLTGTDLYPDASANSILGRAITGWYALEGCRMYIFPHLESTEDLVIEWTGVKDSYADADTIFDGSSQLVKAVRLYLQRERARDLELDDNLLEKYSAAYNDALADLIWKCRQKHEGVHTMDDEMPIITNGCQNPALDTIVSNAQLPGDTVNPDLPSDPANNPTGDNTPVTNPWLYRFAILGGVGLNDGSTAAVAASAVATLINSWNPLMIVNTGDFDNTPISLAAYDQSAGSRYGKYMLPYAGSLAITPAARNFFWPAISSAQYINADTRSAYLSYYPTPKANGGYYYDHIEGPVHLLVVDGNSATPDTNLVTGVQAEWLRVKLVTSPCKYRLVIGNDIPGNWPLAAWGATTLINGAGSDEYVRALSGGILTFTNGLGTESAGPLEPGDDPIDVPPQTQVQYYNNVGAQLVTVNCDSIKFEFFSIDGVLQDTYTIQ